MANRAEPIHHLTLLIPTQAMERFTTLLQGGIITEIEPAISVGDYLLSLPGFTSQYIADRVETIFLDGLPVDDLTTPITGSRPVLAISAAMPGLAGAIFRKNSFHTALRTMPLRETDESAPCEEKISVTLKLFNMVAVERGQDLFAHGCLLRSSGLLKFISKRPQLLSEVLQCDCDDKPVTSSDLQHVLQGDMVFLKILAAGDTRVMSNKF
ncbi:MAG: hypothetical protein KQH63_06240 [Desulfobulbaceae bacterium]|nr:hypothetical protein [Desulfobulbaceae bacterium]